MKRSLVGRVNAWRRRYLRTRSRTGNARSTSWIFKAIPAAPVCERARIAALPLQEIWSRLVLPCLVVFEHSRGGNGVIVISRQQITAFAMGMTLSVLERRPVYVISSRQRCLKDSWLGGRGTSQIREGPKGRMTPFSRPEPRRLRQVIPLGGRGDGHGRGAVVVGPLHPIQTTGRRCFRGRC